jgi:hypothetical protein
MTVDMFGFKRQHKLITSEGMDMIKRQIECDKHNINMAGLSEKSCDEWEKHNKKVTAFTNKTWTSIRQQYNALKKGRFR